MIKISLAFDRQTSRFLMTGLSICLVFILPVLGQLDGGLKEYKLAELEFNDGEYQKVVEVAQLGLEKSRKTKSKLLILKGLDLLATSQISLGKYDKAEEFLNESLRLSPENQMNSSQRALIYLRFAWLLKSKKKWAEALEYCQKALRIAPQNRQIVGESYHWIGRILFSLGYDISAIIWFEKSEKSFESEKVSPTKLDTYRFLHLAWSSRLNYHTSLNYAEKWVSLAENSSFKFQYRQSLYELSSLLSITGQKGAMFQNLEKGLNLSVNRNNSYQTGLFLTSLLLNSLFENDLKKASDYLHQLEMSNQNGLFLFEIQLGKAVIFALSNQPEKSEEIFAQLDKKKNISDFILPTWKITIAEQNKEWEQMIKINQELLGITKKHNFRDGLPSIYLDFAKAYYYLNQFQKSLENLEKSLALIEETANSENPNLALGLFETYHNAYRLLTQIKSNNPQESFELADFLKARLLKDKINNSALNATPNISQMARQKLEDFSLKFIIDQSLAPEIEKTEKLVTNTIPDLNLIKPSLSELDTISSLEKSAIISYFFTLDRRLLAFVWEKGKPIQTIQLPITEKEVEFEAKKTQQDIKNRVFFKRDGQGIYDKLLKPLALTSKHLIIIPDKSLWKIPFQALSSDGEKYLIEEKFISYAPSVSILLEQLKNQKQNRQTIQAFANSSFENKTFQYINAEATSVAEIYNSKPILNARVKDFLDISAKPDILHFSMHAEVDQEKPLDSFLGFRKFGQDSGRLRVEELLNIKLKKGSLVFLASCETNNVLNGEGLVSLAWGMMGAGATTVISAQWEANDKSTAVFTNLFYKNYKQGSSAAEALQKAALELIKNKANNMHEPYYWADFSLNGDFR